MNNEIDFDKVRDTDGYLNLHSAFQQYIAGLPPFPFPEEASAYITEIDRIQPVKSRQVAALVMLEALKRGQEGKQ